MTEGDERAIKAVIFDVGGVLTVGFGEIMMSRALEVGADLEQIAAVLVPVFASEDDTDSIGHRLERGEVTLDDFLATLGDLEQHVRPVFDPASEHYFGHLMHPALDMHAFVDEVRAAGYRTGVLSNTVLEWHPTWEAAIPAPDHFDVVVMSASAGVRKPNPRSYQLVLDRLGIEPHEALFLDDFAPMAEGAREVGLHAIVVRDHGAAIAEARVLLGLA